jgi:hypothetical protein
MVSVVDTMPNNPIFITYILIPLIRLAGGMAGLQNMMKQFQQGAGGKMGNMFGGGGE